MLGEGGDVMDLANTKISLQKRQSNGTIKKICSDVRVHI